MKNENAKHTPGPWSVRRESAGRSGITGREYFDHVIEPLNINAERTGGEFSTNARLIAAAPELLAALELALTTLSSVACNESDEIDNVKTEIANAINKAKGE